MDFEIFTVPVTSFQQNCRVVAHKQTKKAFVVDPGGEPEKIWSFLSEKELELEEIWLTHSHLDHCGGVKGLLDKKKVPLIGHQAEQQFRDKLEEIVQMYGIPPGEMVRCPEPTRYLEGGETIEFAGASFEVRFCPGHSPGHLIFYYEPDGFLLAGDTLFQGSIGRTDLPGGDHELLLQRIQETIYTLPDETKVLPGHGPDTTVGAEKSSNPFVRAAS